MQTGLVSSVLGALGCVWFVGTALMNGSLPINPGWRDQRVPTRRQDSPITYWSFVLAFAAIGVGLAALALNWPR